MNSTVKHMYYIVNCNWLFYQPRALKKIFSIFFLENSGTIVAIPDDIQVYSYFI